MTNEMVNNAQKLVDVIAIALYVILGIFAIILGIIGKSIGGKGYAIAGIVCGAIGIVISIMITAGFLSLFKFIQTYV